jgi:polysaccharide export outer membrane protein
MRKRELSQYRGGCLARNGFAAAPVIALALVCWAVVVRSQEASVRVPATPRSNQELASPPRPQAHGRYLIGIGDVLDIRVFGRPQLSRDAVRVDGRGKIGIPLVEDEIQAACRTESELAADVAARYLKYVRRPQVDVFIREYNSQPVAVIGAVNRPARFLPQRPVRLLELLTFASGPTDRAGRTVQIVHSETQPICEDGGLAALGEGGIAVYGLTDVLAGRDEANPYVRPGDIISIGEAEQVFVVGNVTRPSSISLKEPLTVSRAIAMAGGVSAYSKRDRIRIIRQLPASTTKTEIFVDLKAIEKRRATDVVLQANDIVDVPASGGKRLLSSLAGAIVPTVTQLPVRVIP